MSQKHDEPSIGKRGGEFLILAIYLFGDIWEFWNINHLLCLFLAGIGIFALIWYDDALNARQLVILVVVLLLLVAGVDLTAPPIQPPQLLGWLEPGNGPTPANGCGPMGRASEGAFVIAGGRGITFSGPGPYVIVSIGSCKPFLVEKTDAGIAISTPLYSKDRHFLGRIMENEFDINQSTDVMPQQSGDLSTLVIHYKKQELFYVRYVNKNAILVRGEFYCPSQPMASIKITDNDIIVNPHSIHFGGGCSAGGHGAIRINGYSVKIGIP